MIAAALIVAAPVAASAQDAPVLRAHHVTVGGGLVWSGGYDIGDATARMRGNGPGAAPPDVFLFTAKSRITSASSPELQVGFAATERVALEFGFAFSRPHVAVAIAGDTEAPSQELPGEQLHQYLIGGGVTWQVPVGMGSRMATFVSGGAAFLRQLHEDRTLAETGEVYYAGAGARLWLRGGHAQASALGLRGDARMNFRTNGIDFEDTMRTYPTLSLSVFVGF
ncbi:MAG TPA: hypothetical protein VM096_11375 [Vicinamibacterales bacterium]|nr:hypothetical protein [Vicinamibacterales bacterium]